MAGFSNPEKSTSKARTRRTDASARGAEALSLRLSGLSYTEIAERLDYRDKSGAWRAVECELKHVRRERASEVVTLDLARLDMLLQTVWAKALAGDLSSFDRVLKILERRARYFDLDGTAGATSEELNAARELAHADALSRLAEIKDRIESRFVIAIAEEMSRVSKQLPVRESPWEAATIRLDAFEKDASDSARIDRS